ncbi:MAG: helix-turn-helix domain-containing protein, partial [Casimicrobiaceae bacterium]
STGYFAILTDREGVVVAVDGPIDRTDRRAEVIARVGVDLSEACVGTTAIGTALAESHPVWLHRGEHFFEDTAVYSCAGAPIYDGLGRLAGMLDLTGIMAVERPALRHLVASAARAIETRAVLAQPHAIALALDWPDLAVSGSPRGWLVADAEGFVTGVSREACDMLGLAPAESGAVALAVHLADLFAMKWQRLFDLAGRRGATELPLWSGLMVRAEVYPPGGARPTTLPEEAAGQPLKALEADLIRRTVRELRGNVKAAAERLGISRATIYRKLGRRPARDAA